MILPLPGPGRPRHVYGQLRGWYGPRVACTVVEALEGATLLPAPNLARALYLADLGWDPAYVDAWLTSMGYKVPANRRIEA